MEYLLLLALMLTSAHAAEHEWNPRIVLTVPLSKETARQEIDVTMMKLTQP